MDCSPPGSSVHGILQELRTRFQRLSAINLISCLHSSPRVAGQSSSRSVGDLEVQPTSGFSLFIFSMWVLGLLCPQAVIHEKANSMGGHTGKALRAKGGHSVLRLYSLDTSWTSVSRPHKDAGIAV